LNGILIINTLKNYGINKRGIPYYKFKPLNKTYPTFLVACSAKKKSSEKNINNLYCKIKFKEWSVNDKYPYGIIEERFGEINDYQALVCILKSKYDIYNHKPLNYKDENELLDKDALLKENRIKESYDEDEMDKILDDTFINEKLNLKNPMSYKFLKHNIFSIDPDGCKDIDDAFNCYYNNNTQEYKVYVHIADVSAYINRDATLDKCCLYNYQTLYNHYDKNTEMIPNILSTQICSLKVNNLCNLALTVCFIYDKDFNLKTTKLCQSIIKCNYNLSYKQAQDILDEKTHIPILKDQLDILKNISNYTDSHKIVEYFMVLTNNKISDMLYKYVGFTINRTYKQINNTDIEDIEDIKLNTFMNYYSNESAKYIVEKNMEKDKDKDKIIERKEIGHDILGLINYTHYTSPIRRYIDIEIHRLVKMIISNSGNINAIRDESKNIVLDYYRDLCNNINKRNKEINRYYRELEKLNLVYFTEIEKKYSGYVININNNSINIYIDELNIIYNYNILNNNKDRILSIELIDDKKAILIKNILSKEEKTIILYEKIEIELYTNLLKNDINKLDIKIINPNLEDIYY